MKIYSSAFIIWISIISFLATDALSQKSTVPTEVTVRAQSKDAKFIGTSMGGAYITITEVKSGEVLADGMAEGSTGDTQKLVRDPKQRYEQLSTPGAAKFEATLSLSEPVFVTISAVAPYAKKQAQVETSTQMWLIPGKDITGDGIILEIPGFVIDVLSPQTHQSLNSSEIEIRANIVMMCGCPTSEGGLWDSSEYEIEAIIKKDGKTIDSVPLNFTGQTSTYSASYTASENGVYEITVYAYHAKTGNTGVDKTTAIVSEQGTGNREQLGIRN
ncbi:MAG: hypothetical protein ACNS64_13800 [Candidatus Halalkalibacterium sp. M3_1C_030]